jgi:hypothetical protein
MTLKKLAMLSVLGVVAVGIVLAGQSFLERNEELAQPELELPPLPGEAAEEQVKLVCSACHAYPTPAIFPRAVWRREVRQAYDFLHDSFLPLEIPSLESVAQYYENRAPKELAFAPQDSSAGPCPVRMSPTGHPLPEGRLNPGVANVSVAHLFDKQRYDVLVCDIRYGLVLAFQPYLERPAWKVLAKLTAPCHAEVVDLDGDGILDILVADLGSFAPTDDRVGRVVMLKGKADGTFTPITLLEGVGRVADVQAADFQGKGKLDLVVGVFGWRKTGEILYLENTTTDWTKPSFTQQVLDKRHGAIHVPVGDLNGDGRPDIVALISQEHETIVAFMNEGNGKFRKETIYSAPHPAYGSSGIQLVDMNHDGKLDVLYTNGDIMDPPPLLKPYHGIQWLENRGRFPFEHHPIAGMYGVERALAADFQGNGRLDIVAVSYLPAEKYPQRAKRNLDSVILLEQAEPGKFIRHSLEKESCDHFTCAVGDLIGDGRMHLITGNHYLGPGHPSTDAITIWQNLGNIDSKQSKP